MTGEWQQMLAHLILVLLMVAGLSALLGGILKQAGFGKAFDTINLFKLLIKIMYWLFLAVAGFIGAVATVIIGRKAWWGRAASGDGARFMNWFETRSFLSKRNDGIHLGRGKRLPWKLSCQHVLVAAPSGRGKTTGYVMRNILLSDASVITTDLSGELFHYTSGHMADRGFDVLAVNLADLSQSMGFNPLLRAKGDPHKIKKLATSIVNHTLQGGESFWRITAIDMLNVLFSALCEHHDDRYITLKNVRHLVNNFGTEELDNFVSEHLPDTGTLFGDYQAMRRQDPKLLSSVIASTRAALDCFADEKLDRITSTDTLNLDTLRHRQTVLYIIVPETQAKYYGLFLTLLYEEICSRIMDEGLFEKKLLPVHLLLDEFGQLYFEDFDTLATTIRKRNCALSIILQDLSQMVSRYGRDRALTILSGAISTKVMFGGLSHDTCEQISRTLGVATTIDPDTKRKVQRPLLAPHEIRMLGDGEVIVIHGNRLPVKMRMESCFDDPVLKLLTDKKAVRFDGVSELKGSPLLGL